MRNCNELYGLHLAVFAVCSSEDMGNQQYCNNCNLHELHL